MKGIAPGPRLLPWTIIAMAALLVIKSNTLVRAAVPGTAPSPLPAAISGADAKAPARPNVPAAELPHAPATAKAVAGAHVSGLVETVATTPRPVTEPASASSPLSAAAPTQASEASPVSDSERALLLDLRTRRGVLDAREASLAAREAVLSAAEKRLGTRLDELKALQGRLEALESARKDRDEANWRGLVKLYETMKPRDAAAIFNDLELPVLLQVADRMKEAKAAAILAAMQPERARLLTAELAQMRLHANAAIPQTTAGAPPVRVTAPAGVRPETGRGVGSGTAPGNGPVDGPGIGKGKT